jgi:hypothetical protein
MKNIKAVISYKSTWEMLQRIRICYLSHEVWIKMQLEHNNKFLMPNFDGFFYYMVDYDKVIIA